ncbi:MAG TPA: D-alanine--D-alanine ligase [Bacteroidota bacterium]|nr:D-alanine--D-alanine ligase [Bacteroidota bacterium]
MNIAVFLGGTSAEREVSLASGKAVTLALREAGHTVTPIDPALGAAQPADENELYRDILHGAPPTVEQLAKLSARNLIECVNSTLLDNVDIVFLALHGEWGEDGKVQSLLEMRGKKYTASGVMASALTMDKSMTKILMRHIGVQTGKWKMVRSKRPDRQFIERAVTEIGFPMVVKPNDQGSTVGLTIVKQMQEIPAAIDLAFRYSNSVMLEEYIPGRELTVAIVGDRVLPIIEIKPYEGIYDYQHKYTKGMTEYICPADLPADLAARIQLDSKKVFDTTQCRGFARVDFRLRNDGEYFCLEINTLPGMTATSLVPKAAAAAGMTFPQLCDTIVKLV